MRKISKEQQNQIQLISDTKPDLFFTISEILKLVSAKRGASSELNLKLHELEENSISALLSGDYEADITFATNMKIKRKLTPVGAEVLRELIKDGTISLQYHDAGLDKLENYIQSLGKKYDQACKIRDQKTARANAKKERLELLCQKPEKLTAEEMKDPELLDRLFWKKFGKGSHKLRVRNFVIEKLIYNGKYFSNSGKTRMGRYIPYFEITDTSNGNKWGVNDDLVSQVIENKRPNRRNDPNRNWGLGRE